MNAEDLIHLYHDHAPGYSQWWVVISLPAIEPEETEYQRRLRGILFRGTRESAQQYLDAIMELK